MDDGGERDGTRGNGSRPAELGKQGLEEDSEAEQRPFYYGSDDEGNQNYDVAVEEGQMAAGLLSGHVKLIVACEVVKGEVG